MGTEGALSVVEPQNHSASRAPKWNLHLEARDSELQSKTKMSFLEPLPTIPISPLRHHLLPLSTSLILLQPHCLAVP